MWQRDFGDARITACPDADLGAYAEAPFEVMGGISRMVNRNDGVVSLVVVNGRVAFRDDAAEDLGAGRFLRRTSI